ncbi:uncharacterized protein [Lolium perenne]|uniref:uncharacterized protein isoform X6 n=1 Tax=Lolium perenne TaxID=4522 RepID=UPI003A9A0B8D
MASTQGSPSAPLCQINGLTGTDGGIIEQLLTSVQATVPTPKDTAKDQQLHRHRRWDRRAAPDLSASNCPEDNAKAQGYPARKLCSVQCQQCKCQHQSERFSFEAGLHGSELRVVSQEIPRIFAWKSETLVSL